MANEKGDEIGTVLLNADQIIWISVLEGDTTAIQTVDGKTLWVKNPPQEVVTMVKAGGG